MYKNYAIPSKAFFDLIINTPSLKEEKKLDSFRNKTKFRRFN